MNQVTKWMQQRILILDGATGSCLQKAGMPVGVCPEQWITEHAQTLADLQRAYIEAGSDIVYAPTFGANRIKLREYGLAEQSAALNRKLVQITKDAAAGRALVAGDMTMTGQQLAPLGTLTLEELTDAYQEQAAALFEAGVDLIVIETMMSLAEARAALIAVRECCNLPVFVTMSFGENGRTLYGTDPETAVEVLQGLGADAVGFNCGAGPDKMLSVLLRMAAHANVPLLAKPNAGLPKIDADGSTVYDMDKETFALHMKTLMENGAALVGGCCGTDPSYIALTAEAAADAERMQPEKKQTQYLTTERTCMPVRADIQIGYIDPQKEAALAVEYAEGIYDTLMDLLDEQMDDEADVVCLSVDAEGLDGKAVITDVIAEATQYCALPLAFTSADAAVLEAALRAYPGRAGVVVGQLDADRAKSLCEKYGAVLLG